MVVARIYDEDHIAEAACCKVQFITNVVSNQQKDYYSMRTKLTLSFLHRTVTDRRLFYFCLRTGEQTYAAADDLLSEDQIHEHWVIG